MKNKLVRFTAVFCILCVAANIPLCVYARNSRITTGILDITTTEAALQADIRIHGGYITTKNDETSYINNMKKNYEANLKSLDELDTILVVEATGDMFQYRASLEQDVRVLEVIKCRDTLNVGDVIRTFRGIGFTYEKEIIYNNSENIMYPGNKYLVFMRSSDINQYTGSHDYVIGTDFMNCFNLNRSYETLTCPSFDFTACKDVMHFTASDKIAAAMAEYEKIVIETFYTSRRE